MRIPFLLGFGLLPIWAALAFITYAFLTMSRDHAGMTLWALVAAIPASAVTLLIGTVALGIHSRVAGEQSRKLRLSALFVCLAILALAIAGFTLWLNKQDNEQDLIVEKTRIEEFTKGNAIVRAAVGEPLSVSISSCTTVRSDPKPSVYDVMVKGTKTVYAIVEVDRKTKPPTFSLLCTTPLYMGQREAFKSPCAQ
jgi:uncharacterized membrane protein